MTNRKQQLITLEDIFVEILESCQTVDVADSEFKHQIHQDHELRDSYRRWCDEQGEHERNGFRNWCAEYIAQREEVWDTLSDYDNQD